MPGSPERPICSQPVVLPVPAFAYDGLEMTSVDDPEGKLVCTDRVVIATDHGRFDETQVMDPAGILNVMFEPLTSGGSGPNRRQRYVCNAIFTPKLASIN